MVAITAAKPSAHLMQNNILKNKCLFLAFILFYFQ